MLTDYALFAREGVKVYYRKCNTLGAPLVICGAVFYSVHPSL